MNKLPRSWVEALFKKFLIRYGAMWSDRYKGLGLSPDEIADEWATELGGFSPEEIKRGLEASRSKTFPPTLPEFLSLCRPAATVRPSADEAWALSLKAQDESETVVWTQDMAQAWSLCKPVLDVGDEVGARMAFKAAYERICAQGGPVQWTISEGWDQERRLAAIQKAEAAGIALGYKQEQIEQLEYRHSPVPDSLRALTGELSDSEVHSQEVLGESSNSTAKQAALKRLNELKIDLEKQMISGHQGSAVEVNPDIARTEELKRISAEKVGQFMKSQKVDK